MSDAKNNVEKSIKGIVSEALTIINPQYALALMIYAVLGLTAIVWAFAGDIPHRIKGFGEIVTEQGLYSVFSPAAGQIDRIVVSHGAQVNVGDLLVQLKQPEMAQALTLMQSDFDTLQAKDNILKTGDQQILNLRSNLNSLEKNRLNIQMQDATKVIAFLTDQVAGRQQLFEDGVIVRSMLFESQDALAKAITGKEVLIENLRILELESQQWVLDKNMREEVTENDIINMGVQLDNLKEQYKLSTEIRSEEAGHLVQMNVAFGDVISEGESLLVMERSSDDTDFFLDLYIPFTADENITTGMVVDIEPFIVDRNLHGWLIGEIVEVTNYVSSGASLMQALQNKALLDKITSDGPVFRVRVKLNKDPNTVSGFAWSNGVGPSFKLHEGALSIAYIRVKDKSPIDYLIPIFKDYLG